MMKRTLIVLLTLFTSVLLIACTGSLSKVSAVEIGYQTGDSASHITNDITLPTEHKKLAVSWEVSPSSQTVLVINDSKGLIRQPSASEGNKEITLTAIISDGEKTFAQKPIKLTVIAKTDTGITDVEIGFTIATDNPLYVTGELVLPNRHEEYDVTWNVLPVGQNVLEIVLTTGKITRPNIGAPNVKITLQATLTKAEEKIIQKKIELTVIANSAPSLEPHILDIYYLNDFHGAILEKDSHLGLAKIANLILTKKQENPNNTLFLAGGDMLQGTGLSSSTRGDVVIDLLNKMNLDAFTVGNHEFDWGVDVLMKNFNNGFAKFPILGANVYNNQTSQMIPNMDPTAIFNKGEYKVGVVGTIGAGQESSISTTMIAGYHFKTNVSEITGNYAKILRENQQASTVIGVTHDTTEYSDGYHELSGTSKIDVLFNGHRHFNKNTTIGDLNVLQSGSSGDFVGHVRLDLRNNNVLSAENHDEMSEPLLQTPHPYIGGEINKIIAENSHLFENLMESGSGSESDELATWIAKLMRIKTGAKVGLQNAGGTRASIAPSIMITPDVIFNVFPFENIVKTSELLGSQISNLLANSYYYSDTDGTSFNGSQYYLVATNDYVFDKPENPFLGGKNPTNTNLLMRDLMIAEIRLQMTKYQSFSVYNEIQTAASKLLLDFSFLDILPGRNYLQ